MAQFNISSWPAAAGSIVLYSSLANLGGARPVVVFMHGALRSAAVLQSWADILATEADVVLVDLPGHGRSSPIASATVEAMAGLVHEVLRAALPDRQIVLVGESMGGTIALAIGGLADPAWIRAILAADPPVTMAKQWTVADNFRRLIAREPNHAVAIQVGREVFGISQDDIAEIIYYPLIGHLRTPTLIATGDIALLPPRRVNGITCLFDAVDQFVVSQLYPGKASIRRISNCGHLLLVDAKDECRKLVVELLQQYTDAPRVLIA